MANGRYLLVVLSCAFINDGFHQSLLNKENQLEKLKVN